MNVRMLTSVRGDVVLTPDYSIPTYSGRPWRIVLTRLFGLPNTAPRPDESHFKQCRVLFVDDDNYGAPRAYWVPDN